MSHKSAPGIYSGSHGLKDSGERVTLASGMMKEASNGRGRYDLISPIALEKLAIHSEKGALKYSDHNWELGNPLSVSINSAMRHLNDYRRGDRSEPHLTAAFWQLMTGVHTEDMIERGLLPKELDDMPRYL
jgi:hypothetical protein